MRIFSFAFLFSKVKRKEREREGKRRKGENWFFLRRSIFSSNYFSFLGMLVIGVLLFWDLSVLSTEKLLLLLLLPFLFAAYSEPRMVFHIRRRRRRRNTKYFILFREMWSGSVFPRTIFVVFEFASVLLCGFLFGLWCRGNSSGSAITGEGREEEESSKKIPKKKSELPKNGDHLPMPMMLLLLPKKREIWEKVNYFLIWLWLRSYISFFSHRVIRLPFSVMIRTLVDFFLPITKVQKKKFKKKYIYNKIL